jgi:O-antigen ligase
VSSHRRVNTSTAHRPPQTLPERFAFAVVCAIVIALPLTFDPLGQDIWRLPKELAFRASAILLAVAFSFVLPSRFRTRVTARRLLRPQFLLPLLAVIWAGITTLASTNRLLSVDSFWTVVCSGIVFIAVFATLRDKGFLAVDVALIPAVINAILIALQEYGIWQPFRFSPEAIGHLSSSALIGNPNDVGAYLTIPAVAAAVATGAATGARRIAYLVVSLALGVGIIASGARGCIIAYGVALVVFLLSRSLRTAIGVTVLLILVSAAIVSPATLAGRRMRQLWTAAREHKYEVLFSERLPPFLCAIDMFRDHPIVGVGPGCFKFHYMAYRLALVRNYPESWTSGFPMNFGETHNDHLQLLAEAGIPAYLLFLGAAIVIGRQSAIVDRESGRPQRVTRQFARDLALPLVVAMFLVTMTQFPLQIAASRLMFLYFAGLCMTWSENVA